MMRFSPGEPICFQPPGREKEFGTWVKYNKKTVTVITELRKRRNVSPHLLSKSENVKSSRKTRGKVMDLNRKRS